MALYEFRIIIIIIMIFTRYIAQPTVSKQWEIRFHVAAKGWIGAQIKEILRKTKN